MAIQRYSKQREVVRRVVCESVNHPTADDVYAAVRELIPNISLGTVYRNLNQLTDAGEISIYEDGALMRFDGNTHEHHHFKCRVCGAVKDVVMDRSVLDSVDQDLNGMRVEKVRLDFSGVCEDCL